MPEYVLDLSDVRMNDDKAQSLVIPPEYIELKNLDLRNKGRIRKAYGFDDLSTNASPDVGTTAINGLVPFQPGGYSATNAGVVAMTDTKVYMLEAVSDTWTKMTISGGGDATVSDAYPWQFCWGHDADTAKGVVYFSNGGVFEVNSTWPSAAGEVRYISSDASAGDGSNTHTGGEAAEVYLNKLFIANITQSGARKNRLHWSQTGAFMKHYGTGSGFLDLSYAGGGGNTVDTGITALRVYRDRLYIGTTNYLLRLTGDDSENFDTVIVAPTDQPQGATMYVVGPWLFWVDVEGIKRFDGTRTVNLIQGVMQERWENISIANDIQKASASWDPQYGDYMVYFPDEGEMWVYNIWLNRWSVRDFANTDGIRCIGPPIGKFQGSTFNIPIGTPTNGKVFNINTTTETDDGATITGSLKTGYLRLGELAGGPPGSRFRLNEIIIETANQSDAGVVKILGNTDGVDWTSTATLTVPDAGASGDRFPTYYDGGVDGDGNQNNMIDIDPNDDNSLMGALWQFTVSDDDANSRMDLHRVRFIGDILAP